MDITAAGIFLTTKHFKSEEEVWFGKLHCYVDHFNEEFANFSAIITNSIRIACPNF